MDMITYDGKFGSFLESCDYALVHKVPIYTSAKLHAIVFPFNVYSSTIEILFQLPMTKTPS